MKRARATDVSSTGPACEGPTPVIESRWIRLGHLLDQAHSWPHHRHVSTVSVREAKTHLSRLLQQVEAGEEVVITRGGEPVARLVAVGPKLPREAGRLKHAIDIGEDFEAPLPDSFWTGEG